MKSGEFATESAGEGLSEEVATEGLSELAAAGSLEEGILLVILRD